MRTMVKCRNEEKEKILTMTTSRKHRSNRFEVKKNYFPSFSQVLWKSEKRISLHNNSFVKMTDSSETIQEIAYKLMLEQNKNEKILNGPTERTVFVLGSKGVVSRFSTFNHR